MAFNQSSPSTRLIQVQWNVLGPLLITLSYVFMTWVSWRRWPDVIMDFGQQLYVPWMLSEGQVLYRDVVYFHGPLASYINAALFAFLGPGMIHLALANLVLVYGFSLFLFYWMRQISDSICATLAGVTFVLAFAFAYYWGMGLLNFICPYVYDLTYGFMLGCVSLYQCGRYLESREPARLLGVGLLLGLVFLTKAEMFAAAFSAVGITLLMDLRGRVEPVRKTLLRIVLVVGPIFVFPLFFFFYFAFKMPMEEAAHHLFSQWIHGLNLNIHSLFYYRFVSGTMFLEANLLKISFHLLVYALLLAFLIGFNLWLEKRGKNSPRAGLYFGLAVATGLILLYPQIPWRHLPRSFPVILVILCLGLSIFLIKNLPSLQKRGQPLSFFMLGVFALVLTLKVFFNLNTSHLGFVLALPATLVMVTGLLHFLPKLIESGNKTAWVFRCGTYGLVAVTVLIWTSISYNQYQIKTYPVGNGADMIYDFPPNAVRFDGTPLDRAEILSHALNFLEKEVKHHETILSVPDSMMINYLLRRRFPTRDTIFNPLVWIIRGDPAMIQLLEQRPPDYVVYVNIDFTIFGSPVFGKDYASGLKKWIEARYTPIRQFGGTPFQSNRFGVQVLRLKDSEGNSNIRKTHPLQ
ncbi:MULTISPECIES: hypothetical protein [unclassified Nitrospina]|uniref:hypothetical protein n=1 Tax=unclassified Nitrospina TaxID=2638683 RepID=UPI003F96D9CD